MVANLKRSSWCLIAVACLILVISYFRSVAKSVGETPTELFSNPPNVSDWLGYPAEIHLKLLLPFVGLAAALMFVRSDRIARWSLGVIAFFLVSSLIICYQGGRDIWNDWPFWIDLIATSQGIIVLVFLFESVRQFVKWRKVQNVAV
jgi:hypothetical protein